MNISELTNSMRASRERLAAARREIGDVIPWYRYDILGNLPHVDALLHGQYRELDRLAAGLPVADGGADSDLAFILERNWGWQIDMVDTAAANMNGLRGARALRDHLGSKERIEDIDDPEGESGFAYDDPRRRNRVAARFRPDRVPSGQSAPHLRDLGFNGP